MGADIRKGAALPPPDGLGTEPFALPFALAWTPCSGGGRMANETGVDMMVVVMS